MTKKEGSQTRLPQQAQQSQTSNQIMSGIGPRIMSQQSEKNTSQGISHPNVSKPLDNEQLSKFKMDLTRCMRDYNNSLDAKNKMAEETKGNNSDQHLSFFDRLPSIFDNLSTNFGFLDALLTFGNTLELLYIGGMVFQPPTIVPSTISTMGSL